MSTRQPYAGSCLIHGWLGALGMSYVILLRSFGGLSKRKGRAYAILGICFLFISSPSLAENWSYHYIQSLPDSAFSAVEIAKDGKKIRHLPHHDHTGEIDVGHLKSALGRIHQVKWVDPANLARAKEHLEQHYRSYKEQRAKPRYPKAHDIND
jgi:hypothetical protein